MIFDKDGLMTKPDKSQLLKELEKHLSPRDCDYERKVGSVFIFDVMAAIRRMNMSKLSNFGDLLNNFMASDKSYHQFGQCDYLFESYAEP